MANYVFNTLTLTAKTKKEIKAIKKLLIHKRDGWKKRSKKETYIDFNALKPFPAELEGINSGGCQIDGEMVKSWRTETLPDGTTKDIKVDTDALVEKYGYSNWYDWNLGNYGTKTGQPNVSVEELFDGKGIELKFDTAWTPPEGFLILLAEAYPKLGIEMDWQEEQGYGGSYALDEDGEIYESGSYDAPNSESFEIKVGTHKVKDHETGLERDEDSIFVFCKCTSTGNLEDVEEGHFYSGEYINEEGEFLGTTIEEAYTAIANSADIASDYNLTQEDLAAAVALARLESTQ